jgi:broad specificity phosphatase PhoE
LATITLHLFRHGKVDGHQGDVPLADDAGAPIDAAAARLLTDLRAGDRVVFLSTRTRRSRDTAQGLRDRLQAAGRDLTLGEVREEQAVRNPDLYLAGHRVEMVSTGAALAAQLPDGLMTAEKVEAAPFFGDFLRAPDRIGYWLRHEDPAGEDARAVARRVVRFCRSLGDADTGQDLRIVAVSHSPVMRAVLVQFMGLADPGEPGWVEPIDITLTDGGGHVRFRDTTRQLTNR